MSERLAPCSSAWFGVALAAALLLVGSAIPLPSRYNRNRAWYGPDKWLHLLGHVGLAGALAAALADDGLVPLAGVAAVAVSSIYGVGTELLQEAIPGREFERGDVLAGVLGSILGVVVWRLLVFQRRLTSTGVTP